MRVQAHGLLIASRFAEPPPEFVSPVTESDRISFATRRANAMADGRRLVIDGVEWVVYELSDMPYDRRSSISLVFECAERIRRVRDFPREWRELPDPAVAEIMWRR